MMSLRTIFLNNYGATPYHTAAGAGIAKLYPSLENTMSYGTSRFTSKDHENTSIDDDDADDDSTSQSSDNDKYMTPKFLATLC